MQFILYLSLFSLCLRLFYSSSQKKTAGRARRLPNSR